MILKTIISKIIHGKHANSDTYIKFLRAKGCKIGEIQLKKIT